MPDRVFTILGRYDIFGKSIPGIALLFGLIPILPKSFFIQSESADAGITIEPSFVNFAAFVFVLFLLGLILGQAVHTFADVIERVIAWCAWRVIGFAQSARRIWIGINTRLRDFMDKLARIREYREASISSDAFEGINGRTLPVPSSEEPDGSGEEHEKPEDKTYAGELGLNDPRRIWTWLQNRGWGIYDSLASHRHLFKRHLQWYFDPYLRDRWPPDKEKMVFDLFMKHIKEDSRIDIDITSEGNLESIDELYPVLTSIISRNGPGRAMPFQARYSFCRSMWVVFLILVGPYAISLFSSSSWLIIQLGYLPLIRTAVTGSLMSWLLIGMLIVITLVFLFGAGIYKRHYIEYLLADYYAIHINEQK